MNRRKRDSEVRRPLGILPGGVQSYVSPSLFPFVDLSHLFTGPKRLSVRLLLTVGERTQNPLNEMEGLGRDSKVVTFLSLRL